MGAAEPPGGRVVIGRAFVAGAVRYASPPYYAVPVIFDCEQAVVLARIRAGFASRGDEG